MDKFKQTEFAQKVAEGSRKTGAAIKEGAKKTGAAMKEGSDQGQELGVWPEGCGGCSQDGERL